MNVSFFKKCNIEWNKLKYIGFDLDGTLYDEFDFIYQVYWEINKKILKDKVAFKFMLNRWLEKGSSYPFIFEETYNKFNYAKFFEKEKFIKNILQIYYTFIPNLRLTYRTENILEELKKHYKLFLISDGNANLQRNKFNALKLNTYFGSKYVFFTGDYGTEYYKPNTKILNIIKINFNKAVFIGDREIDEKFAKNSNMQFIKVYNMIEI